VQQETSDENKVVAMAFQVCEEKSREIEEFEEFRFLRSIGFVKDVHWG
jgi:hypothetical protein